MEKGKLGEYREELGESVTCAMLAIIIVLVIYYYFFILFIFFFFFWWGEGTVRNFLVIMNVEKHQFVKPCASLICFIHAKVGKKWQYNGD